MYRFSRCRWVCAVCLNKAPAFKLASGNAAWGCRRQPLPLPFPSSSTGAFLQCPERIKYNRENLLNTRLDHVLYVWMKYLELDHISVKNRVWKQMLVEDVLNQDQSTGVYFTCAVLQASLDRVSLYTSSLSSSWWKTVSLGSLGRCRRMQASPTSLEPGDRVNLESEQVRPNTALYLNAFKDLVTVCSSLIVQKPSVQSSVSCVGSQTALTSPLNQPIHFADGFFDCESALTCLILL